MLAPSPILSKIPHILFDIISVGVDAVLCHEQDICKTVQKQAAEKDCTRTIKKKHKNRD